LIHYHIDYQLGNLKFPSQSTAFFYRDDGHLFYQITFYNPVDNLTLIYDVDKNAFFHLTDAALDHHPARRNVYYNNNVYFISLNNASLYQTGTNFTTYNENFKDYSNFIIDNYNQLESCIRLSKLTYRADKNREELLLKYYK
jgi:hypothetical protein